MHRYIDMGARLAAVLLASSALAGGPAAAVDAVDPVGRWVLVNDWGGTYERVLFDITKSGGEFEFKVVDAPPHLEAIALKKLDRDGNHLSIVLHSQRTGELRFDGELKYTGVHAGEFVGTFQRQYLDPARLKRVSVGKLQESRRPFEGYLDMLRTVREASDDKERSRILAAMLRKKTGPETSFELRRWLILAETVGSTEAQVRDLIRSWLKAAEPYGSAFVAEARLVVLRSLQGQAKFAGVSLDVAEEARKNLANFRSDDDRSSLLHFLAAAAMLSNKDDLASEAEREAAKIDARLDADYNARVPPFKVEAYAGRKNPDDDQVVLLELFTGVLCAPCVAADVACDAMDSTFKPKEVVLLQYHLPIPGTDPLANKDTNARAEYYDCHGVPTIYFNGEEYMSGGGPMEMAEQRYREIRQRVEQQLHGKTSAAVELHLTRTSGNKLHIRSSGKITGDKKAGSNLRLRLVLAENLVRYNGGNGVRMNRHLVRDFPGGTEGKKLAGGRADLQLDLDLNAVRRDLEDYRQSKARLFAFACPRPIPAIDLKNLSVVAFVQDDDSKRVLQAVQVPVPER